jgi:CubicO group peptidase (beta-lactamase class C family)
MGEGALGEVFREVTDTLFVAAPGERFAYSNPGYSMVGYVVERVGGARFAAQVERRVLRPAGMLRSTFRPLEVMTTDFSQGHAGAAGTAPAIVRPFTENTAQWAAGFLFSTAGELARFAQLLMDGGSLDGRPVLAPTTVPQLTTGQVALPQDPSARYGYGLVIGTRDGVRRWGHAGGIPGFLSTITLWPDQRAAVIVLGNRDGTPLAEIERFVAMQLVRGGR